MAAGASAVCPPDCRQWVPLAHHDSGEHGELPNWGPCHDGLCGESMRSGSLWPARRGRFRPPPASAHGGTSGNGNGGLETGLPRRNPWSKRNSRAGQLAGLGLHQGPIGGKGAAWLEPVQRILKCCSHARMVRSGSIALVVGGASWHCLHWWWSVRLSQMEKWGPNHYVKSEAWTYCRTEIRK